MSWRVAGALLELLGEVNQAAPGRSHASDGTIGDASHASRDSDHNPWVIDGAGVGVVRALDVTNDPAGGCDSSELAEQLRQLALGPGHPALQAGAYVIADRRIASATYGWSWRAYTGSNPHDHHMHVSVSLAEAGYDSRAPWGVADGIGEDTMTPDQLQAAVKRALLDDDVVERYAGASTRKLLDSDLTPNDDDDGRTVRRVLNRLAGSLTRGGSRG